MKKKIIILSVLLAVVVAATVGVIVYLTSDGGSGGRGVDRRWQAQYDLGVRYLNEGRYEEAVIAFNAAIDIERRADGYAGRAEAYMGLGKYRKAAEDYTAALQNAAGKDDETRFKGGLARAYAANGDIDEAKDLYQELYDATDDRMWRDKLRALEDPGRLSGVVYAWGADMFSPVPGAEVTVLDRDTDGIVYSIVTGDDGTFLEELPGGDYQLFVHTPEYQSTKVNVRLGNGESVSAEPVYLLSVEDIGGPSEDRDEEDGEDGNDLFGGLRIPGRDEDDEDDPSGGTDGYNRGALRGMLTNALDGQPLTGARVGAGEGWNREDFEAEDIVWSETDENGRFELMDLKVGYYTLFVEREDYLPTHENVVVSKIHEAQWQFTVTPTLNIGEQLRIVLTWGEQPADLDSHLIIDRDSSGFYTSADVFYQNMRGYDSYGSEIAMLDVDDTSSYGPETETIYEMDGHSFTYMVYDYSSSGDPAYAMLNRSGATVSVYGEDGLIAEYHVPTVGTGSYWEVFSVDERGRITSVNDLRETSTPSGN